MADADNVGTATSPATPTDGYVHTTGGRLHYLRWGGTGPRAHLLHANGFCAGTYAPFIRYLTRDLTIFASDIRGHGGSDPLSHHRIRHWKVFAADLNPSLWVFIEKRGEKAILNIITIYFTFNIR